MSYFLTYSAEPVNETLIKKSKMVPHKEKRNHWIRQDNAASVCRWLDGCEKRWLESKEGEECLYEIIKDSYKSKSTGIIDIIHKKTGLKYPWGLQSTPFKIIENMISEESVRIVNYFNNKNTANSVKIKDHYINLIKTANEDGWVPTADWGAKFEYVFGIQRMIEENDFLMDVIGKIKPNDSIGAKENKLWVDFVSDSKDSWSFDLWSKSFLNTYRKEMTEIDRDWSRWALDQNGALINRSAKVIDWLSSGVLRGSAITADDLKEIKLKYDFVQLRSRLFPSNIEQDIYLKWESWLERLKLIKENGSKEIVAKSERRSI